MEIIAWILGYLFVGFIVISFLIWLFARAFNVKPDVEDTLHFFLLMCVWPIFLLIISIGGIFQILDASKYVKWLQEKATKK